MTRLSSWNPLSSNRFRLLGWQEYSTGMSYCAAMAFTAVKSEQKFSSVSMFSSR